jgi:murein DD-endopeptidase MepM/ murein hydrolase activator NlpD
MLMLFRRRHARAAVAMMSAFSIAVAALGAPSESATASVGSDRTQIAQLEQQIAAQGAHVESLVSRYDEVQGHIGALDVQIDHDHALLAADQRAEAAATIEVRGVAIQAYMTGVGMGSPTVAIFGDASSIRKAFEQNNYLAAANTKLNDDLNSLQRDQDRTRTTQSALRSEQVQAKATLRQLTDSKSAATSAIASDEAMLSRVSGNLRSLLAAANKRRQAAQLAAERALATAAPSPQAQPSSPQRFSPPPPPSPSPSPGGYANPLRAVIALSSERIDQGVDYSGFGPIYAVGNGVVLSTVNAGWPGGTFIAYRLTDGPANGLVVYAAEDIEPTVQIGATVTSSTVLGQMYAGPTGIETGWADPSASGDTMARTAQQFDGSNSTAFGYNFSQFLQSVGAPGGVLQNSPPTGFLPGPWPHW